MHFIGARANRLARMSSSDKASPSLTIDRAAFLLLRVKKAFKKKKQQRKEKTTPAPECNNKQENRGANRGRPAPLLRSRTLPAIVAPGLSILQAQIDARYEQQQQQQQQQQQHGCCPELAVIPAFGSNAPQQHPTTYYQQKRDSSVSYCGKLLTPRISFTDDSIGERRVSDTGPSYRDSGGGKDSRASGRLSTCSIGSAQPLTRLARLLNQRPSFTPSDDIPRRLSWERRDCSGTSSCLPRSSSIDSLADWGLVGNGSSADVSSTGHLFIPQDQLSVPQHMTPPKRSPSPLLGSRTERLSIVSPNIGRRVKGQRAVLALFAAVEHGHVDKARAILESTDVDVNSVNNDCLSPLDVAVLSNNRQLAKMLVAFGAQEGNKFKSPETLGSHLAALLMEAEHRVQELGGGNGLLGSGSTLSSTSSSLLLEPPTAGQSHRGSFSSQHNNPTGCGGGSAEDKQLALWERRARALRKMLLGFDQARPPDVPFLVTVDVTSTTSVTARFHESADGVVALESPICTKFRLQWSLKEDFGLLCGERELLDMKQRECRVEGLLQGHKYYFRAAAGNLKGYSRFRPTSPAFLTPSSWRDIDGRSARFAGRLEQLDSLFTDVRGPEYSLEAPGLQQRRNHKKKTTIKQLFTATSKFQKNLRRGVFLSCLLYHEDKVLVTNEDFLPCIEVDETYPSSIYNDFHWLMKVACTWDDVKSLRQDMEKCHHSSSSNHFRIKLLQAAAQMQAALCIQDLGQLYHKPIRDVQGTLVFSTVNYVRSPKLVSVLNSRWLPLAKVTKKIITHEDSNVADILMASIQDQMTYHQVSGIRLPRGLYLGYLKMQSSVDSIQVVVPAKSPNVLPHCKIRDNPHVSAEEWEYLKRTARLQALTSGASGSDDLDDADKENASLEVQSTEQQKLFIDAVAATARRLFNYMEIGAEESLAHRLYDAEVIDLTADVSFLVAVPPPETACSVPGTRELLLQRGDLLSLPVQVFEMVHLSTYQRDVINRYSRLSCILELDTAQAQHSHREAFSTSELTVAKDKLARLQDLQTQMNSVWKGARWLVDVISFARDRGTSSYSSSGICMKHLLSLDRNKNTSGSTSSGSSNGLKRSLLQLPPRDPKLVKASPGRGSWPGPTSATTSNCCSQTNLLSTEFSKSEQQLTVRGGAMGPPYQRKGSNCSNCSSASEPYKSLGSQVTASGSGGSLCPSSAATAAPGQQQRLPPSRSEDTLLLGKYGKQSPRGRPSHQVVAPSSASASTSPLLGVKTIGQASSINSTSESAHSISSDEYPMTRTAFGQQQQQQQQQQLTAMARPQTAKLTKPTASVAAIADKQLNDDKEDIAAPSAPLPGILQVYAAYETGLASGTSLKLHVTGRTTAREVVDLVVKQLNMAVLLKGLEGPVYSQEELTNFCLVAVIGARERCLRDDFKPLQLQNPWKKGRLYVRQKQDVLAALEHSSKHTAYL